MMARQVITADFGKVQVGGQELPGVFTRMTIRGQLRTDSVFVPGASGKSRQPLGWEPATVSLSVRLTNDHRSTPYEKLAKIAALFYGTDNEGKPRVYRLINKHAHAWKIREVLFLELQSDEDNNSDYIDVVLHFEEYRPVVIEKEARARRSGEPSGTQQAFARQTPASSASPSKPVGQAARDDDEV